MDNLLYNADFHKTYPNLLSLYGTFHILFKFKMHKIFISRIIFQWTTNLTFGRSRNMLA